VSTERARLRDFLPDARELALLFAVRGIACVAAWQAGFRALSDDDYARIAIAQRFAHAPSFDPSGTSWLPAPFWAYGAALRCFGVGLNVARGTAIIAALLSTALLYVAARLLGSSRLGACVGAGVSTVLLSYSVLLGIAAVPEVPCAALLVFATATLARPEVGIRPFGGAALVAACLSRYEAWPLALAFGLYCVWDALRARRPAFFVSAALAWAGPALWMTLGRFEHGDAVFFVSRVAAYRRALCRTSGYARASGRAAGRRASQDLSPSERRAPRETDFETNTPCTGVRQRSRAVRTQYALAEPYRSWHPFLPSPGRKATLTMAGVAPRRSPRRVTRSARPVSRRSARRRQPVHGRHPWRRSWAQRSVRGPPAR